MPPTHDDAALVVQLVRWGKEMHLPEAVTEVFSDKYDPEASSADDPAVRSVLGFGETVGTLVEQGVLDRGLVLDLWWVAGLWKRVGPAALKQRHKFDEPRLYENFEALASG
ncbi:MAG TPA: DUF4760 domain-containing protein [Acidimicrobiales bacterium]|nr:DUF4760 domain-containing protein [Acidimicrobiales bacterium]